MKKKKGFTLVELIAVIGITVIFGAIVLGISITSGKLFSMTQSQSVFNDEARLIISTLEEDLRIGKEIDATALNLTGSSSITINGII
ncbi:MAG: PilW family protein, partial [Clostridium paraputrificum]